MNWWYYEFVIFVFLIVVGAFLIEVIVRWEKLKRRRLVTVAAVVFCAAWLVIFYGSFVEPRLLVVRAYEVNIGEVTGRALRAAVVSDLHLGPYKGASWTQKVVERINKEEPDIIFLLGDFLSDRAAINGLSYLKNLHADYGMYAVTGNHEYQSKGADEVVETLENFGIDVLRNEATSVEFSGRSFTLVGTEDIWFEADPTAALKGLTAEDTIILLSHNPDIVYALDTQRVDLVLSGHTHGGQIRLPIVGPIAVIPTALGQSYDKGLFTFENMELFITSGLGETGPRARLFNPPEISMVTIDL